jgi:hypothetical protein
MPDHTRITVRFSEADLAAIRRQANAAGLPPSTYVRLLVGRALDGHGRDQVLHQIWQQQQFLFGELLRRLLQLRLMVHDRQSPDEALSKAADSVARFFQKMAAGDIAPAEFFQSKE